MNFPFASQRPWKGEICVPLFVGFLFGFLAIEFLDELTFGSREVSWPQIRDDLVLSHAQIGLLLALPGISGQLIEPFLGILADRGHRRRIILGGGISFAVCLALLALSHSYAALIVAFFLIGPASGAFVSLSQTVLMNAQPERREQNMARWAFAGSAGSLAGPLLCAAVAGLGLGWRGVFGVLAVTMLPLVLMAARMPMQTTPEEDDPPHILEDLHGMLQLLRRREVQRWLLLMPVADLMLDVLHGFLALYLVDVAGASNAQASLAVAVWMGVGLIGDLLLIPLLERVSGLQYLRYSAWVALVLYPAFLLVPSWEAKLVLLGLLGFSNAGWYSILQARLYHGFPGRSGVAMVLGSLDGMITCLLPLGIGATASVFGLGPAMSLILLGPLAILVGLPRKKA